MGHLVLKPDNQPAYRLAALQGRRFRIVELQGFAVEFRGEGAIIDEGDLSSTERHVHRKAHRGVGPLSAFVVSQSKRAGSMAEHFQPAGTDLRNRHTVVDG